MYCSVLHINKHFVVINDMYKSSYGLKEKFKRQAGDNYIQLHIVKKNIRIF